MTYSTKPLLQIIITGTLISFGACNQKTEPKTTHEIPLPPIEGDFVPYPELSDEFEGPDFDTTKWFDHNPGWLGRQPAFFSRNNVTQEDGKLNLSMRLEDPPEELIKDGYHTYSSAAVRSRHTVKYGYFEIKARAMKSRGSSSFWFYDIAPGLWTEIDVFELSGKGPLCCKYNMNSHIFGTPLRDDHASKGDHIDTPYNFADDFHVLGFEWTPYVLRWYVDGEAVLTMENTYWHQPLTMNFDSETMPDWMGLPDKENLPSTYSIEYIRTWKYKSAYWMNEGPWERKEYPGNFPSSEGT
jgi:beta-glucanase (GH16 family)